MVTPTWATKILETKKVLIDEAERVSSSVVSDFLWPRGL